jgi:hypothetical protein
MSEDRVMENIVIFWFVVSTEEYRMCNSRFDRRIEPEAVMSAG